MRFNGKLALDMIDESQYDKNTKFLNNFFYNSNVLRKDF